MSLSLRKIVYIPYIPKDPLDWYIYPRLVDPLLLMNPAPPGMYKTLYIMG